MKITLLKLKNILISSASIVNLLMSRGNSMDKYQQVMFPFNSGAVGCFMQQMKEINDGNRMSKSSIFSNQNACYEQVQKQNKFSSKDPQPEKIQCIAKSSNNGKYALSNFDINVLSPNSW